MPKKCAVVLVALLLAVTASRAQTRPIGVPQVSVQQPVSPARASSISVQQDVSYGTVTGHTLLLDVYDPGDNLFDRAAILLLHGGGWSANDKSGMRDVGMFFARHGFVAFSVDYRLTNGKDNLWPAQLDDVQRAVRWIRAHASKHRIDPGHIGAYGFSAGGQLAALLGMEDTRDNSDPELAKYSSRVKAVVDVSGPSDFTTGSDRDDAFLTAFFGGDFAHHADVWKDASPVFHVSKKCAPFLIVHGSRDEDVPIAQAQELADKLKQAKVPVRLVTLDDVHNIQTAQASERVAFESLAFFTEYLRPER